MLVALWHHIRFHGKSSDINHDAFGDSAPAARASPVCDYTKLPVYNRKRNFLYRSEASHAPPLPTGAGMAQGGGG